MTAVGRVPTWTSLIEEALREPGVDFLNYRMLCARTGGSRNQISAACFHLRKVRVIDVVIDRGEGWWFALPTYVDTRKVVIKEVKPATKNRRTKVRREADRRLGRG